MRIFRLSAFVIGVASLVVAGSLFWGRVLPGGPMSLLATSARATDFAGDQPAPAFPTGLDWINTEGKPLTLEELRGKVVLLDFWTYGCVNCMHIIPDLKYLERKYDPKLVVIGVHSAKFKAEGRTDNIRKIVRRYELTHPVVNDQGFAIWNAYGAQAWPTLVVIDPQGNIVGALAGEGHRQVLDQVIGGVIKQFAAKGEINTKPLPFQEHKPVVADTFLRFPGKVLADAAGKRLFIADTNHNRLVVTDLSGELRAVIGNGNEGLKDGTYDSASFHHPQGMTLADGNTLYVADTGNNAIRKVDLVTRRVSTVAGDGRQDYLRGDTAPVDGPLNTPWDVLYLHGQVYVAMAGQHQIWRWQPGAKQLEVFAGNGFEGLHNGPRLDARMAQPSALATDGKALYVADSEASAIRRIGLGPEGRVETLVGLGLFEFGDRDGQGRDARLQHPLGLAVVGDSLYIADTYNSKIKKLDLASHRVTTVFGGDGQIDEPGGLSAADGKLYIPDTNHNVVRTLVPGADKAQVLPVGGKAG